MQPLITVQDLGHIYNPGTPHEAVALRGIDLAVDRGEVVAIVGANGSGKSTLARHLNALLLPTSGSVHVAGLDTRDPRHHQRIRQTVGMVFQNPDNQIVGTTVEEDVAFGPENLGLEAEVIRQRITAALAAVDMADFRQRPPHRLSGGQKQRVAIAGILAMEPAVMVLDEPTAMLDPRGRREVLATLARLNREKGMTIVFTTHFMEEAAAAQRVVVMAAGRIKRSGPPGEVFADLAGVRELGLELPPAAQLAEELRRRSLPLPPGLLREADVVNSLCPLLSNN